MFDPSTLNCHSFVNKFTVCMNSFLIFWWTDLPIYESIKTVKKQDKSINETSVSSISTNWSILIKSDLPIFINLLIDWQIDTDFYRWTTLGFKFPKRTKPYWLTLRILHSLIFLTSTSPFISIFQVKATRYLIIYLSPFLELFSHTLSRVHISRNVGKEIQCRTPNK